MNSDWIPLLNRLGSAGKAFLFIIDFEMRHPLVLPLDTIDEEWLRYSFRGHSNSFGEAQVNSANRMPDSILNPSFISSIEYERAFRHVRQQQSRGNSFLTNLTFPSELHPRMPLNLRGLFPRVSAPYRLWIDWSRLRSISAPSGQILLPHSGSPIPDEILVFSPETFIQTHHGRMYTYPMKGTSLVRRGEDGDEAIRQLLADSKERAEHVTVVDLLRNDLGRVGSDVCVEDFRYCERIPLPDGELLQISSRISAALKADWQSSIGDILAQLMPAGSVSGAPKRETCKIISEAEAAGSLAGGALPGGRGYYSGIAALYDGWNIDSAVLIRFIEQRNSPAAPRWFFRSGGGITIYSDWEAEYRELQHKVRLPGKTG